MIRYITHTKVKTRMFSVLNPPPSAMIEATARSNVFMIETLP